MGCEDGGSEAIVQSVQSRLVADSGRRISGLHRAACSCRELGVVFDKNIQQFQYFVENGAGLAACKSPVLSGRP
jgi:hypothetical protein